MASDLTTISANTQALQSLKSLNRINGTITALASHIQDVGEYKSRLNSKQTTLSIAVTNTENVRSTPEDTDLAKEQMEVLKQQKNPADGDRLIDAGKHRPAAGTLIFPAT